MFSYQYIIMVIAMGSSVRAATIKVRNAEATATVTLCTGASDIECFDLPIVLDSCVDFKGGLSFFDQELTSAVIQDNLVCTFFCDHSCVSYPADDMDKALLTGGEWNFHNVTGTKGPQDLTDQIESFACSRLT